MKVRASNYRASEIKRKVLDKLVQFTEFSKEKKQLKRMADQHYVRLVMNRWIDAMNQAF